MSIRFTSDVCVHCGRRCNDYEGGHASAGEGSPLCHPNVDGRPDCYHMVTVYHHQLEDCDRCTREPYQPLTAAELHDSMLEALRNMEQMVRDAMP